MTDTAAYHVKTPYGSFLLDEAMYRDYMAGRCWFFPGSAAREPQAAALLPPLPQNITPRAAQLRDTAERQGPLSTLAALKCSAYIPYKSRMAAVGLEELNLSVRSMNGLLRAGVRNFAGLAELMQRQRGVASVRNLGAKSSREIHRAFLSECYARLSPREKAEFWQRILDSAPDTPPLP